MILKLKLLMLPVLAILGPSFIANALTVTSVSTDQETIAKNKADYELISISAKFINGNWLVDGQQKPVIKTSMTKRNYLTIENQSAITPLNLVIPKIAFEIISKNGVLLQKIISLDEGAAGKEVLWLEPKSSMTISFVNDLSSTPLQALVSVSNRRKEVIAIFGPDQGKKFTLPLISNTSQSSKQDYPSPDIALTHTVPKTLQPGITIPDGTKAFLKDFHAYKIKATENLRSFTFSEFVFVGRRNSFIGGSDYFAKELMVYPGESFDIITTQKTTMRAQHD